MDALAIKVLNGIKLTKEEVSRICREDTSEEFKEFNKEIIDQGRWVQYCTVFFKIKGYEDLEFNLQFNEGLTENQEDEFDAQVAGRFKVTIKEVVVDQKHYDPIDGLLFATPETLLVEAKKHIGLLIQNIDVLDGKNSDSYRNAVEFLEKLNES